jgi:hypothetical protein
MGVMPKRTGKKQKDVNELARSVIERIEQLVDEAPGKNPAAVALGRKGGLKGGRARMDALTADERRKLAVKGAKARWAAKR